jgi:hypothetical protein
MRVPISAAVVAGTTAYQVGDKDPAQAALANHPAQQIARTVSAEGDAGAIAAQASRRDPDEGDDSRNGSMPRDYAGAAAYEGRASGTSKHRFAQTLEFV